MPKVTRRGFIAQTSVSVATIGMLAAVPAFTADPEATDVAATDLSTTLTNIPETLIAHVSDPASGEISLLVGTKEIIYRDPELVMRLLRAVQ